VAAPPYDARQWRDAPDHNHHLHGLAREGTVTVPRRRAALCLAAALAPYLHSGCAGGAGAPLPAAEIPMPSAVRDSVHAVLTRALADGAFPGAYVVVGSAQSVYVSMGVGHIDWPRPTSATGESASEALPPAPDDTTVWDLASLTKVVGMTTAMMQLAERGLVELDAPVYRYLPDWTGGGKERVTVRHLLTHSAGLPNWRPLYREAATPTEALALVYATPLDTVPGARMLYSDLGAILAGEVVSRVTRQPLDEYLARELFGPLGMTATGYRPDPALRHRVAPTEFDPWRGRHLRGEVHDENAFTLGGVSGHAGLFGTARDLTRFARMLLNGGILDGARIVRQETIALFTARQDPLLSHRALGWETARGAASASTRFSARAFGHTGFTGTSLWVDPDNDVFVLLLTNRVNPTRENRKIGAVRVALADAVMAAMGRVAPSREPSTAPPS
jgi:CubicO group peptidase (beta-lactamase class C family)